MNVVPPLVTLYVIPYYLPNVAVNQEAQVSFRVVKMYKINAEQNVEQKSSMQHNQIFLQDKFADLFEYCGCRVVF